MSRSGFSICLIVRVQDSRPIAGLDEQYLMSMDGVSISAKMQPPTLFITASGFCTEPEARQYLPRLKCGLWSAALTDRLVFKPSFEEIKVIRPKDPEAAAINLFGKGDGPPAVDGCVQGEGYYVFQTGQTIGSFTGHAISATASSHWSTLEGAFLNGIKCEHAKDPSEDAKLSTALDLYLSSFYQSSGEASFITLVSVLEVLAPQRERPMAVVKAFKEFVADLKCRQESAEDPEEKRAFQAAIDDAHWKKYESISQRIRELVRTTYDGDPDQESHVKCVKEAYAVRSRLLHLGTVDPDKLAAATISVRKAVKAVLAKRLGLSLPV